MPSRKRQEPGASANRDPWTPEEDARLCRLVAERGDARWSDLAVHFPGRIGKQCRERWHNQLRPNINRTPWTEAEERIIVEEHKRTGNKWVDIARRIPGRTENAVKNHWNATLRCKDAAGARPPTPLRVYIQSLRDAGALPPRPLPAAVLAAAAKAGVDPLTIHTPPRPPPGRWGAPGGGGHARPRPPPPLPSHLAARAAALAAAAAAASADGQAPIFVPTGEPVRPPKKPRWAAALGGGRGGGGGGGGGPPPAPTAAAGLPASLLAPTVPSPPQLCLGLPARPDGGGATVSRWRLVQCDGDGRGGGRGGGHGGGTGGGGGLRSPPAARRPATAPAGLRGGASTPPPATFLSFDGGCHGPMDGVGGSGRGGGPDASPSGGGGAGAGGARAAAPPPAPSPSLDDDADAVAHANQVVARLMLSSLPGCGGDGASVDVCTPRAGGGGGGGAAAATGAGAVPASPALLVLGGGPAGGGGAGGGLRTPGPAPPFGLGLSPSPRAAGRSAARPAPLGEGGRGRGLATPSAPPPASRGGCGGGDAAGAAALLILLSPPAVSAWDVAASPGVGGGPGFATPADGAGPLSLAWPTPGCEAALPPAAAVLAPPTAHPPSSHAGPRAGAGGGKAAVAGGGAARAPRRSARKGHTPVRG